MEFVNADLECDDVGRGQQQQPADQRFLEPIVQFV
jgi:hypothetical protein